MTTTVKLDKHGRLALPENLRDSHHWRAGASFSVEDRPDGLLLRPLSDKPRARTTPAAGHGTGGSDRALADAVRDRYARLGH